MNTKWYPAVKLPREEQPQKFTSMVFPAHPGPEKAVSVLADDDPTSAAAMSKNTTAQRVLVEAAAMDEQRRVCRRRPGRGLDGNVSL